MADDILLAKLETQRERKRERDRRNGAKYRARHRERIRERRRTEEKRAVQRDYQKRNKERIAQNRRAWRKKHSPKFVAKALEWARQHPNARKAINRRHYLKNLAKKKAYNHKYKSRRNERKRLRRCEDPQYAIKLMLHSRLYMALRGRGHKKCLRTVELIGCSIADLKLHIERQFQEGMNWENRRQWAIDHIRPCAAFDLTDPEQQKQCFHYTNLRPLWAVDNIRKGAKIIDAPYKITTDFRRI